MLIFFRLSLLDNFEENSVHSILNGSKLDNSLEIDAVKAVIEFLQKKENQFTTTIETDNKILQSDSISTNMKHAVILRKTQKQILLEQKNIFKNILKYIELPVTIFAR